MGDNNQPRPQGEEGLGTKLLTLRIWKWPHLKHFRRDMEAINYAKPFTEPRRLDLQSTSNHCECTDG